MIHKMHYIHEMFYINQQDKYFLEQLNYYIDNYNF